MNKDSRKIRRNLSVLLVALFLLAVLGILADKTVGISGNPADRQEPSSAESAESAESDTLLTESSLEVHFLDVGQSDCTLVISDGHAMLIDCGDENQGTKIQFYLKKQGIEQLDYLILTHPDADHIGGAPVIITKFDIDQVYMSGYEKDNATYRKVIDALEYRYFTWSIPEPGSSFSLGGATVTMLGPNKRYSDSNNNSLVLKLQHGENTFLFTGDAEESAEKNLVETYGNNRERSTAPSLEATVLKVGHHGSSTSTGESFLDTVNPKYAVISCGKDNSYGFPHSQTLKSLNTRNIQLFRTDEQGTITVTSDGTTLTWNCPPIPPNQY